MSLLLHLSDIHLTGRNADTPLDDHKLPLVSLAERATSGQAIRDTLRTVAESLQASAASLDGVVVSGDVTVKNGEAGYAEFSDVLSALGSALPSNKRILVVPGNHDVAWGEPPSSPARYARFIEHIRKKGYVTPLLDGIDFDDDGNTSGDWRSHCLHLEDTGCVVVPINSSNYCGSVAGLPGITEPVWNDLESQAQSAEHGSVASALYEIINRLRTHDVARISPQQFRAIGRLLDRVVRELGDAASGDRIAVLHHQLLPVTGSEEFKPFESITNLGQLRAFLAERGFRLVVHGHKHAGFVYRDYVHDYGVERGNDQAHVMVVVSGASGNVAQGSPDDVCRLLAIEGPRNGATLSVTPVPRSAPGASAPFAGRLQRRVTLWHEDAWPLDPGAGTHYVRGSNIDETYARLQGLLNGIPAGKAVSNLVCEIDEAASAKRVPAGYPEVELGPTRDRQAWFDELVSWWQRPETRLREAEFFNHGSRIYSSDGDQLDDVVQVLTANEESSRAVVAIFSRATDKISDDSEFPSFCFAQFAIRRDDRESLRLDCIGYFRKQEMRYWWPVNVAELGTMQTALVKRLRQRERTANVAPGRITTVACIAKVGMSPPRVAIAAIDRAVDASPQALFDLAYMLFHAPEGTSIVDEWRRYFNDLMPADEPAPDGVPVALDGLVALSDYIQNFAKHHAHGESGRIQAVQAIVRNLNRLVDINRVYLADRRRDDSDDARYRLWRNEVTEIIKGIVGNVAAASG